MIEEISLYKVKDFINSIKNIYRMGYELDKACIYIYAGELIFEAVYKGGESSEALHYKEYDDIEDFTKLIFSYGYGEHTLKEISEIILRKTNEMVKKHNSG